MGRGVGLGVGLGVVEDVGLEVLRTCEDLGWERVGAGADLARGQQHGVVNSERRMGVNRHQGQACFRVWDVGDGRGVVPEGEEWWDGGFGAEEWDACADGASAGAVEDGEEGWVGRSSCACSCGRGFGGARAADAGGALDGGGVEGGLGEICLAGDAEVALLRGVAVGLA